MAEELADIQNEENAAQGVATPDAIPAEPVKAEKPLSIRESIQAAVKTETEKERIRDEKGKFTAPEKVAAEKPAKAEASAQTEAVSKPSAPPPGWSQASKDYFNSLPADHPLRQDVDKRELEVSKGFKDYSDKNKQYQEVEQVIAPFRSRYQQHGVKSDAEAIKNLFDWEYALSTDPVRGISQIAQKFGIDLKQFAQESPAQVDIPEHLRPVLDQVGQLNQRVRSLQDEREAEKIAQVNANLSTFAKDHPHFEAVKTTMGYLMAEADAAGRSLELKDAYDRAVWANPSLRDQILAEREEKRQADLARTQTEAAKNARLAAVSPPPRARQGAVNGTDKGAKNVRGSILNAINSLREDSRA